VEVTWLNLPPKICEHVNGYTRTSREQLTALVIEFPNSAAHSFSKYGS
jgi:hypothetical protein